MPGSLHTIAAQTAAIEAFYRDVQGMRELAYRKAEPRLAPMGLLSDQPVSEESYDIPIPPLSLGRVVEYNDGQRPGPRESQIYKISGTVKKRGVEPIRFTEADRLATRVRYVEKNAEARGRTERLMADIVGTTAIENGTNVALQKTFDEKAFFATDHFEDPVKGNGAQSNLLALPLTPDNLASALTTMRGWKAENGLPVFHGFEPDVLLMVPRARAFDARKALREFVGEGGVAVKNVVDGEVKVMVSDLLTSTTAWYLWVTNAGPTPVQRMVFRDMKRRDKGPDSELYRDTDMVEIYADEWTDYRLTDWRLGLKSAP